MIAPDHLQGGQAASPGECRVPAQPMPPGISRQVKFPQHHYASEVRQERLLRQFPYARAILSYRHESPHEDIASLFVRMQVSALVRLLERLEDRQNRIEFHIEHSIRPALAHRVRDIEWYGERDAIPAAASAEYEWKEHTANALGVVDSMMAEFSDLPTRLSYHVKIIERLADLLKVARSHGNRNLTFAVLTVHDATYSVYSEDMTSAQAEVVRDAVARLQNVDWNRDALLDLDRFLRNAGFETVPSDKFVSSHIAARIS